MYNGKFLHKNLFFNPSFRENIKILKYINILNIQNFFTFYISIIIKSKIVKNVYIKI